MSVINDVKDKIMEVIKYGDGDSFDDAYNCFKIISDSEISFDEQVEVFSYICEYYGTIETEEKIAVDRAPYRAEKDVLKSSYGQIVDSLLIKFLKSNCNEKEFYESLWKVISSSLLFEDEKSKVFALYYIIIDARIPYFSLDFENKYSISNEKYKELRKKYVREIKKTRFILKTEFSQKTERASMLLAELHIMPPRENANPNEIDEYEEKLMKMVEILPQKNASMSSLKEIIRILG